MRTSRIDLYINGVLQDVTPIYSDSLAINKERESGEMYYRTKLDGTIKFAGKDFDLIEDQTIDTEMTVEMAVEVYGIDTVFREGSSGVVPTTRVDNSRSIEIEQVETLLVRGIFTKLDCTFNYDDKICEVKVTSIDDYEKLLGGIDNEYDLVALAPERNSVTLTKRGVLQVYRLGDTKITNIIGNMSYEVDTAVDVEDLTPTSLVNTYHFARVEEDHYIVRVYIDASYGTVSEASGYYEGYPSAQGLRISKAGTPWYFVNLAGTTTFVLCYNDYYFTYQDPTLGNVFLGTGPDPRAPQLISFFPFDTDFHRLSSTPYNGMAFEQELINTFARVLTDLASVSGQTTFEIPEIDIVATNLNYRRVYPYQLSKDLMLRTDETQVEPTKWGVNDEGRYFVQPTSSDPTDNIIPIGWNTWIPFSVWLKSTVTMAQNVDRANAKWTLRDAYPLHSVIQTLLNQIDPTITFGSTADYSKFLYGTGLDKLIIRQYNLPYYDGQQLFFITPVTNVKRTYYNQAARKGNITLKQVLDMLRNTMQLYWFVDSEKRLRIEHITWFKNGGTYLTSPQPTPIVDLTNELSPMWMKRWSEGLNSITYEPEMLNKRYEFAWGDKSSEVFEGYPIDINNLSAKNGKTSSVSVANFVSDIDLITSAPDAVSDDVFALIATDNSHECQINYITPGSLEDFVAPTYGMQNGVLSFYYLESAYWLSDMGGTNATTKNYKKADGSDGSLNVRGTQRVRKQKVKFPIATSLIGQEGLIRTGLGDGQWIKASFTPEDGITTMELMLDTENSN